MRQEKSWYLLLLVVNSQESFFRISVCVVPFLFAFKPHLSQPTMTSLLLGRVMHYFLCARGICVCGGGGGRARSVSSNSFIIWKLFCIWIVTTHQSKETFPQKKIPSASSLLSPFLVPYSAAAAARQGSRNHFYVNARWWHRMRPAGQGTLCMILVTSLVNVNDLQIFEEKITWKIYRL